MKEDEARRELAAWAAARRESDKLRGPLVRDAYDAGVTKKEIHEITRLARTTIDDILKEGLAAAVVALAVQAVLRPDADYLAARNRILAAVSKLDPEVQQLSGPDGHHPGR